MIHLSLKNYFLMQNKNYKESKKDKNILYFIFCVTIKRQCLFVSIFCNLLIFEFNQIGLQIILIIFLFVNWFILHNLT